MSDRGVPVITFLSDYGPWDEFVGVCHAVIARRAPRARIIDLGHGIARQDVRAGAVALRAALPYAPVGVHLAVVDPGVGGDRRAVALRVGADGRTMVGPDNGLLISPPNGWGAWSRQSISATRRSACARSARRSTGATCSLRSRRRLREVPRSSCWGSRSPPTSWPP